jgi:uncharacterized protein (TIGR03790 family)
MVCSCLGSGHEPRAEFHERPGGCERQLPISRSIAEYYAHRSTIRSSNVCHIRASTHEDIDRAAYDRDIAAPIGAFLKKNGLVQSIFYIVTTSGVPLRIEGTSGLGGDAASVDSELAALYFDLTQGKPHQVDGSLENPFSAGISGHSAILNSRCA